MPVDPYAYLAGFFAGGGDSAAFDNDHFLELLWEAWGKAVFGFVRQRSRGDQEADDFCQETFVSALIALRRSPPQRGDKPNFRAWLFTIARHVIAGKRRKRDDVRAWTDVSPDAESDPGTLVADPSATDPFEELRRQENSEVLLECVEALARKYREAITGIDIEEKPRHVVADSIGSTLNALGVLLHRGRKRLRECVELRLASPATREA
ncbi:MAG: RNA polymerase sigma factor (sigma-70 family) [Pseudohongiellaceae bacterium]|jgi:RNA polymerase sigma factor (sigma-70 family)